MQIGSPEHKELFCRSLMDSHRPYEPSELPWPELDALSLARLRAVPIWTTALEVETGAGVMLKRFAKGESDPLVRRALALQGYEEERHGRILEHMVGKYGLAATPNVAHRQPTRKAFLDFGYNECVDSFAGFGIFRLAREARIVPESLASLFARVIVEEARHIVFFVNWVAWDRYRRGLRGFLMQAPGALLGYAGAIGRRLAAGRQMRRQPARRAEPVPPELFADATKRLTPTTLLRACVEENERYMAAFDPRLLRPRVIPALGRFALAIFESIEWLGASFRKEQRRSLGSG